MILDKVTPLSLATLSSPLEPVLLKVRITISRGAAPTLVYINKARPAFTRSLW